MNSYNSNNMADDDWGISNATVIDYGHRHQPPSYGAAQPRPINSIWETIQETDHRLTQSGSNSMSGSHFQMMNSELIGTPNPMLSQPGLNLAPLSSFGPLHSTPSGAINNTMLTQSGSEPSPVASYGRSGLHKASVPFKQQYNTSIVEDDLEDMDISDDEKKSQNINRSSASANTKPTTNFGDKQILPFSKADEVKSGAAFYLGLILFIPPLEQISNTNKGSSAMKMLYASFEFSLKTPIKIEIKPKEDSRTMLDAAVIFQDNVIVKTSVQAQTAHNEISVKALEMLSETCYTIQAKGDYFTKCKLIDASQMKTLNLKKWETVSQKYPKLLELTKESHIQKTMSVFLFTHTSAGVYDDIVCCNLTRQEVSHLKSVVDFFQLTMLPCCVSTKLSKKESPCVVSIHKYTSAKKLMQILIESGGENDKFRLHPPDTFKDFFKLHHSCWDPNLQNSTQNNILKLRTTLEDEELQSTILKPYENIVAELFKTHKRLPKDGKENQDNKIRQSGDDFMKDTLKIDVSDSKNVAPVERMQLLLKYMEQLQEYGSRVLTSGRPEMIKIYHNAIENLRKDLDTCRKDIEKEQNNKTTGKDEKKTEKHSSKSSKSPSSRRRSSPKVSRKSSERQSRTLRKRSVSPRRRPRSRSPRKRRSPSPKRRSRSLSPRMRGRSRSPRLRITRARDPSPRRLRSPRSSPVRRARSPRPRSPNRRRSNEEIEISESIFNHQVKQFVEIVRRNRIEIEDTPIERRFALKEKQLKCQDQLHKLRDKILSNTKDLGSFHDELDICKEELEKQAQMIAGIPHDVPINVTPPSPWSNPHSYQEPTPQYVSYPFPNCPRPPNITQPTLPAARAPNYQLAYFLN